MFSVASFPASFSLKRSYLKIQHGLAIAAVDKISDNLFLLAASHLEYWISFGFSSKENSVIGIPSIIKGLSY